MDRLQGPADMEEGVSSLEDARRLIKDLRERYRSQSRQLLAWRRRFKAQEEQMARLSRERGDQLRTLSSQLLLLESRLCRKQKDIATLLAQREEVILRQQRSIQLLQGRLADAGLAAADEDEANADSLNDSDSAVVLEDAAGSDQDVPSAPARLRPGADPAVTVVRSISDAVEQPNHKYSSLRRCNGLLRRPEILETVYSVEEDGDADVPAAQCQQTAVTPLHRDAEGESGAGSVCGRDPLGGSGGRLQALCGSFERLRDAVPDPSCRSPPRRPRHPPPQHSQVTTYNRVMSNHRSVTKPKDVKYKRINKAKSKSLEELRGRLRNWVDKGGKVAVAVSLDQSYA